MLKRFQCQGEDSSVAFFFYRCFPMSNQKCSEHAVLPMHAALQRTPTEQRREKQGRKNEIKVFLVYKLDFYEGNYSYDAKANSAHAIED